MLPSILASHQLINHINQFLETNETPYFMKSIDCIKAFREKAIQVGRPHRLRFLEGGCCHSQCQTAARGHVQPWAEPCVPRAAGMAKLGLLLSFLEEN